jgi:phosphonopyruvate decarboxylase
MILLVGWRGEPGISDEPQHLKQGKITPALFEALGIDYLVLDGSSKNYQDKIKFAVDSSLEKMTPFAIIVRQGTFDEYKQAVEKGEYELSREESIALVYKKFINDSLFVSTTGHISRELYEISKDKENISSNNVFFTVGSMGFASQIALGLNLFIQNKKIVCLDGDGSLLMHMGGMTTIGQFASSSYIHIVLNNCSHDSVGGQPTVAGTIDLPAIALSSGYKNVYKKITTRGELISALATAMEDSGPTFIEVMVKKGARADLGRPKETPIENKFAFITYING